MTDKIGLELLKNTKEFQSVYIKNYIKHNSVCKTKNLIDILSINIK